MSDQIVDGHSRQAWWNVDGKMVIESHTISDIGHGTPISIVGSGMAGPYMIEPGISSPDHIAEFFGLNDAPTGALNKTTERRLSFLDALRKTRRSRRSRAVRSWRDASDAISKVLIALGLGKRLFKSGGRVALR
jgi:hypothetical protein